VSNNEENFVA